MLGMHESPGKIQRCTFNKKDASSRVILGEIILFKLMFDL